MSYTADKDLEFLGGCSNGDLKNLFEVLTFDPKDNSERFTSTLRISDEYKRYGDDYKKYWKRIAEELQLFGGNTVINIFRGGGVVYREVASDVASHLKADINSCITTKEIENKICEKLISDLLKGMSDNEIKSFLNEIDSKEWKKILSDNGNIPLKSVGVLFARQILKMGGFASYKLTVTFANALWRALFGKGLSFAANKTLTKTLGSILGGPISLALNAWLVADLTGPAMRVTVPAVFLVSSMRQKHKLGLLD